MARLFKKAAAAKNIPLLALALFSAVFMGNLVYASVNGLQTQQWVYDASSCTDPTNKDCYSPATGDLEDACEQTENEVCGINAPDDGNGQPDIQGQLATDLASGVYLGKPNIYTSPRTN